MNSKNVFVIVLLILIIIPISSARPISFFDDIKEKYQDYQGNWQLLTADNLANYPVYLQTENSTYYIVQRMDDNLTINKNITYNGSVNFRPFDISFTIEAPASKMAQISQVNGSGQRRIRIPESVKQTYKRFSWDNKLPIIFLKNATWNMTVLESDYWYSRDNGLWFNFKTANVTGLALDVNASFVFSSWLVNNATTIGYTSANISTDGYWSAFGGGSIGTPLNASIRANLSGYWDCESTSGTTEYGINKYGGFPNGSIKGTWYGNTTLNYTSGQNWGNACSLNGVNDYIDTGNDGSLNITNAITISAQINTTDSSLNYQIIGEKQADIYLLYLVKSGGLWYPRMYIIGNNGASFATSSNNAGVNLWNHIVGIYDTINGAKIYLNEINTGSAVQKGTINTSSLNLTIGRWFGTSGMYNGSIKEFIITSSSNPIFSNSTYASLFNLTIFNQTASSGKIINAVRFNISNLNVQNNTANISARQNGTSAWSRISTNYVTNTWINQTYWASTDFLVEIYGNGSSRAFIVSGQIDEAAGTLNAPTISNITGNFWINHTWIIGGGNQIPNTYNVSVNGTWNNGSSSTFRNNSYSPHTWQNITVCGYNSTNSFLGSCGSQNTRISNNIPIMPIVGNFTVYGGWLNFSVNSTDADLDILTYSSNNTFGIFNTTTGDFNWSGGGIVGNYTFYFTVNDGYGGTATQNVNIIITDTLSMLLSEINKLPTKDDVNTAGIIGLMGGIVGAGIIIGIIKRKRRI